MIKIKTNEWYHLIIKKRLISKQFPSKVTYRDAINKYLVFGTLYSILRLRDNTNAKILVKTQLKNQAKN